MFFLIKIGKSMKSVIDGAINHTMLLEKSTAALVSFVSTYIQIIARIETRGIAASIAPAKLLRFDISEMRTIKSVVMISFKI